MSPRRPPSRAPRSSSSRAHSSRHRHLRLKATQERAQCTLLHVNYVLPVVARLLARQSCALCCLRRRSSYSLCFVKHVVHVFLFFKKHAIASRLCLQLVQNLFVFVFFLIDVLFVTRVLLGNSTTARSPPSSSHRALDVVVRDILPSSFSKGLFVTSRVTRSSTSSTVTVRVLSLHNRAAIAIVVAVVAGVRRMHAPRLPPRRLVYSSTRLHVFRECTRETRRQ